MRLTSELMQFETGISIRRYLPASATAGFDRWAVIWNNSVSAPRARMTATSSFMWQYIRGEGEGPRYSFCRSGVPRLPCRHATPTEMLRSNEEYLLPAFPYPCFINDRYIISYNSSRLPVNELKAPAYPDRHWHRSQNTERRSSSPRALFCHSFHSGSPSYGGPGLLSSLASRFSSTSGRSW